ncbi:hypothetical protein Q5P01_009527 [Channa striata]|uniref:Uncharacterized protein n=1 Tax=Channa striata TaxID=64152 RepID=A0AA88MZR1_CHASR|nr:hypothetical protein Q5P01_009527 [Channa striata]
MLSNSSTIDHLHPFFTKQPQTSRKSASAWFHRCTATTVLVGSGSSLQLRQFGGDVDSTLRPNGGDGGNTDDQLRPQSPSAESLHTR